MSLLTKVRIFSPLGAKEGGRAEEELEEGEVPGDFLMLVLVVLLPLMRELPGSLPLPSSMFVG